MQTHDTLTEEERLKAIAYQFIALYERWSEDRQVAAKQGADIAEFVKLFSEQVQSFKTLETEVRQAIITSIQQASTHVAKTVAEETSKEATRATEKLTQQLAHAVRDAEANLKVYQQEVIAWQWKVIGITMVTTLATCLLLVWLLIPKPTLPLSNEQIKYLNNGVLMEIVWPKLSKKEKDELMKLADNAIHSEKNTDKGSAE